jgi:transcriptional regulator EpsA
MIEPVYLDQETRDRVMHVIETSLYVRNSSGFFLWTQGAVQTLLPHEILLCCIKAGPGRSGCQRWFSSSRYFKQEHFEATTDPETGIVSPLMREWFATRKPKLLLSGMTNEATEKQLARFELRSLVAHGVRGWEAESGGFFLFGRTTIEDSPRIRFLLEILLPYLNATFSRVLAEEISGEDGVQRLETPVTPREVEILHWIKEGKRTGDIATYLGLSPFTVRNHVKNIFRKLGAKSRSHAVAQAMSLGILVHNAH